MVQPRLTALLLLPLLALACDREDEQAAAAALARQAQAVRQTNGTNLNGTNLNGTNLNGTGTSGGVLAYAQYSGATLNGGSLTDVHLDGSELVATSGSTEVRGTGLVGMQHTGVSSADGGTVSLRITDAYAPTEGDVWTYVVEFESSGTWYAMCPSSPDLQAMALQNRWDYREGVSGGGSKITDSAAFTWACREQSALAKCVDLGYWPWDTFNNVQLADHHQACTRMIRADYCGTGVPYTASNVVVNLYDNLVLNGDTDNWTVEAEWTAAGARCLTSKHRTGDTIPCASSLSSSTCGNTSHFNSGTHLMTELL